MFDKIRAMLRRLGGLPDIPSRPSYEAPRGWQWAITGNRRWILVEIPQAQHLAAKTKPGKGSPLLEFMLDTSTPAKLKTGKKRPKTRKKKVFHVKHSR